MVASPPPCTADIAPQWKYGCNAHAALHVHWHGVQPQSLEALGPAYAAVTDAISRQLAEAVGPGTPKVVRVSRAHRRNH